MVKFPRIAPLVKVQPTNRPDGSRPNTGHGTLENRLETSIVKRSGSAPGKTQQSAFHVIEIFICTRRPLPILSQTLRERSPTVTEYIEHLERIHQPTYPTRTRFLFPFLLPWARAKWDSLMTASHIRQIGSVAFSLFRAKPRIHHHMDSDLDAKAAGENPTIDV